MNEYIFARIFVKFVRVIAVLVFLGGVIFVFSNVYLAKCGIENHEFKVDRRIKPLLEDIQAYFSFTQKKLLESLGINHFPTVVKLDDEILANEINKTTSNAEEVRPEKLQELAFSLKESSDQMKNYHKHQYDESIKLLRDALLQHATNIKNQINPIKKETNNPAGNKVSSTTSLKLFSANTELENTIRVNVIDKAQQHLHTILQISTKQRNIDAASKAIDSLGNIKKLVDLKQEPPASAPVQSSQEQQLPQLNAEKAAEILELDRQGVIQGFYMDWVIDSKVEQLKNIILDDIARREELKNKKREIYVSTAIKTASVLVATLFLSFSLLVTADLVSAFLNISSNTDIFKYYSTGGQ